MLYIFSAQNKRKLLSRQGRVSTEPVRKCFFRFLPGFSGSAVGSLNITVNEYTELRDMIRNDYSGRLVDVLELKM